MRERLAASDDASAVVSAAGLSGQDATASKALDLFVSLYGAVAGDLIAQLDGAGESHLVAKAGQEAYLDPLGVEIALEVEQVDLQAGTLHPLGFPGGSHPDVGHRVVELGGEAGRRTADLFEYQHVPGGQAQRPGRIVDAQRRAGRAGWQAALGVAPGMESDAVVLTA